MTRTWTEYEAMLNTRTIRVVIARTLPDPDGRKVVYAWDMSVINEVQIPDADFDALLNQMVQSFESSGWAVSITDEVTSRRMMEEPEV